MAELAKKEQPSSWNGCVAWKEMWPAVRKLTPAEGLALVCLTSWVEESGLVRASDRQVCSETGVSRDVMKRLRRKMGAIGIQFTPGSDLSHDSCSYDFRKVLEIHPTPPRYTRGCRSRPTRPPRWRLRVHESRSEASPGFPAAARGGNRGPLRRGRSRPAGPPWRLGTRISSSRSTCLWNGTTNWKKSVDFTKASRRVDPEEPVYRPLPPYEQWLARR